MKLIMYWDIESIYEMNKELGLEYRIIAEKEYFETFEDYKTYEELEDLGMIEGQKLNIKSN